MAVLTRPLSASEVQKAKPAETDYELFDGQGLTLMVKTTGKKSGAFATNVPVRLPEPQLLSDISPPCHLPVRVRDALETLRLLILRINEKLKFAINSGLLDANPASTIGDVFEKPKKQHMATIRPERLLELVQRIETTNLSLMTRYLIKWQLLSLVRPGEVSGTMWCEIDTDKKLWTIPPERMKKRREHIVPLTDEMLWILEQLKPISGTRRSCFRAGLSPRNQ